MALGRVGAATAGPAIASDDHLMAVWTNWILFATLALWTASGGSGGPGGGSTILPADPVKYVIYSLPLTLGAAYYLSYGGARPPIDDRAFVALAMYLALAVAGILINSWFGFFPYRDVFIVCSYLLLFVFWFRAPASIMDVALGAVAACLAIEAAARIGPDVTLVDANGLYAILGLTIPSGNTVFGSHGILESTLGFPLGVIFLFYLHKRKWSLAAVAGMLQLLAFKRITFAGVALAVAFDAVVSRNLRFGIARRLGCVLVVALSITAIFSTSIFQTSADFFQLRDSSANGISLGRYDIAVMLWDRLDEASTLNWLIGFGAGAADAVSQAVADLNPHNDWLKILFDYGLLGTFVMHLIFFMILTRHRLGLMIYIYTATLMVTDNIFIYMFYYPFIAMIMCVESRQDIWRGSLCGTAATATRG